MNEITRKALVSVVDRASWVGYDALVGTPFNHSARRLKLTAAQAGYAVKGAITGLRPGGNHLASQRPQDRPARSERVVGEVVSGGREFAAWTGTRAIKALTIGVASPLLMHPGARRQLEENLPSQPQPPSELENFLGQQRQPANGRAVSPSDHIIDAYIIELERQVGSSTRL